MKYDTIIIGAGSMGMAAGYFLAKSGRKTLLLDAFSPPHQRGSHHGDTRIIRHAYGEEAEYVPLALKAQKLWNELEALSQKELFLQAGVLNAGPAEADFIQTIIRSAELYELPLEILTPAETEKRWPGMHLPADYIGCFEPSSGVLKCGACVEAYRELAVKHGAAIRTDSRVQEVTAKDGCVTVRTENQTFQAKSLVVSAGAWSGQLLEMLGLSLPLQPVRKTFAWFDAEERLYDHRHFPAFSFEAPSGIYYGFPSIDGSGIKTGRHDGGADIDPDEKMEDFGSCPADTADLRQFLGRHLPSAGRLKFGKTCMYTMTPDEDFIIDRHPVHPNIVIAAGFSGHGFKFSSAVGHILSDLIITGKTESNIAPFRIGRFG